MVQATRRSRKQRTEAAIAHALARRWDEAAQENRQLLEQQPDDLEAAAAEPFQGIPVVTDDRLIRLIATGHHQRRTVQVAKEKMMEGCVRQQDAEVSWAEQKGSLQTVMLA